MYYNGYGVPKDIVVAYSYWIIAAAQGDENAIKNINTKQNNMTIKQMAKAQELSREWMEKHR